MKTCGRLERWRHLKKAGETASVDKVRRAVKRLTRRTGARRAKALEAADFGTLCDITALNSFLQVIP